MSDAKKHTLLTYFIALVWLVNGLYCKVLDLVPRHREIIAHILETEHERTLAILIGTAEIVMAGWVISRYKSRLNAIVQMAIVGTMNILEFLLVPDLLLWGRLNALFALGFIGVVYYHTFILEPKVESAPSNE